MAMKRPAAASTSAAKKSKVTLVAKTRAIESTLLKAPGVPVEVLRMMAGTVKTSLDSPKDARSPYAEKCLDMIDDLLESVVTYRKEQVSGLEAKIDESNTEKASRASALKEAEKVVADKKMLVEERLAAHQKASESLSSLADSVRDTQKETKAHGAQVAEAETVKQALEATLSGDYQQLKVDPTSVKLAPFIKAMRKFDFEFSLVKAAEETFAKSLEERGTFDSLVQKQLDTAFSEAIAAKGEVLSTAESVKAANTAKLQAAEESHGVAEKEESAAGEATEVAKKELAEALAALKAAQKSVKGFEPEMKKIASSLNVAKKDLADSEKSVLNFNELRERLTPPPPVEEEPEVATQGGAEAEAEQGGETAR